MLNIKKNIFINATPEKVWYFLLSLKHSMSMNRSHTKVTFPSNFNFDLDSSFQIHQNLAIVKYTFDTTIIIKKPFQELAISKVASNNSKFSHTISYHIKLINSNVRLGYDLKGNFGSGMIEMSLKPILYGIIIDELRNIKLAIESSDKITAHHNSSEKLNPI